MCSSKKNAEGYGDDFAKEWWHIFQFVYLLFGINYATRRELIITKSYPWTHSKVMS